MEDQYTCTECKDTGFSFYVSDGVEVAKPCRCRKIIEARVRLQKSGLAKDFRGKSFENFETFDNEQLEQAKRKSEKYVATFDANDSTKNGSLLLCGQVGSGKTHLGTASSIELINMGIPVVYMGYREVITQLKAKVADAVAYSKELDRYKNAEVLYIDDFLKGRLTEADVNIMYDLINFRYNNSLPLIISTELTLDELINFDEAIGSRVIEMCRGYIIVFRGKELNYRLYRGSYT